MDLPSWPKCLGAVNNVNDDFVCSSHSRTISSILYSPPDEIFKMAARFTTVTEEEIRQMNEEATPANTKSTCLLILKQLSPSVSVPSEKY